jgi:protease-4
MRERKNAAGALLVMVSMLLVAGRATAQVSVPFDRGFQGRPSLGIALPPGPLAGDANPTAIELNPGQVGFVESTSVVLVQNFWAHEVLRAGRGGGAFVVTPLLGARLGLALQWLSPSWPGLYGDHLKSQVALALPMGRSLAFGGTWNHLISGPFGGRDSFDLGVGWRPGRFVALGIAAIDVGGRSLSEETPSVSTLWKGELALRPLGDHRLELAGGVATADGDEGDDRQWRPHARFMAKVGRGVGIFGGVDRSRGIDETLTSGLDVWRGSVGLSLDLQNAGLRAAGLFGENQPDPWDGGPAGHVALLFQARRNVPLLVRPTVQVVELSGMEADRVFVHTLVSLDRLAGDPTVGAVLLEIDTLNLGLGRIEELRQAVRKLRARKPVIAHLSEPRTREYYLASLCDRVVIHPAGQLTLTGLAGSYLFFQGVLDRLSVNVELVRIGAWKGAMEPFVATEHTEAVRENLQQLLSDQYAHLVGGIARGRPDLTPSRIESAIDKGFFGPEEAVKAGLADALVDKNGIETYLEKALGKKIRLRRSTPAPFTARRWSSRRVGVVLLDGAIAAGRPEGAPPIGFGVVAWADPLIEALEALRGDAQTTSVVLRVNSPGGEAFASDRIARAVARLAQAKPVVVSMGDVAASGGYYVAAPSRTIFASPSTLTGSIGIFSYKVDVSGLLDMLGITTAVYRRGPHADFFSPYRAWSEEEKQMARSSIGQRYDLFVRTVAKGRKMSTAAVDAVGQGRVFTGAEASKRGLVDRLGGFGDALAEAVRLGRVDVGSDGAPDLVFLPEPPLNLLKLLTSAGAHAHDTKTTAVGTVMARFLGTLPEGELTDFPDFPLMARGRPVARLLVPLLLGNGQGVEARLPFELDLP